MELFDSDEEDQQQEQYQFYESDAVTSKKNYEHTLDAFMRFVNQNVSEMNKFEEYAQETAPHFQKPFIKIDTYVYEEKLGIFDVVKTSNPFFNKVCQTFAALMQQVDNLHEIFHVEIYDKLIVYGELPGELNEEEYLDGDAELYTSRMVGFYKKVYNLLKRVYEVTNNIIKQLTQCYNKYLEPYPKFFKNFQMDYVFESLGKALSILYTLDQIIDDNTQLKEDWGKYKRMLQIVKKPEPEAYNTNAQEIRMMEKELIKIDRTVLSARCLKNCISQNFDPKMPNGKLSRKEKKKYKKVTDNKELNALFKDYIKKTLKELQQRLATGEETNERKKLLYFLQVYALYRRLFYSHQDKKLWKAIWALQKQTPILILHSHILTPISRFLINYCSLTKIPSGLKPKNNPNQILLDYLRECDQDFAWKIQKQYVVFTSWTVRMESINATKGSLQRDTYNILNLRARLIINGLVLANQIKVLIQESLLMHIKTQQPLPQSLLPGVKLGLEMLKAIEMITKQNEAILQPTILCSLIAQKLVRSIQGAQNVIKTHKKYRDMYASCTQITSVLRGPPSKLRKTVLKVAANFLTPKVFKNEQVFEDFHYLVWKFDILSEYKQNIQEYTDCTFLYWTKEVIPTFFQQVFNYPKMAKKVELLFEAFRDPVRQLQSAQHIEEPKELVQSFKKEIIMEFFRIVKLLTKEIEDHLRYIIHSVLIKKIRYINPFQQKVRNLKQLLNMGQVTCFDVVIDVKHEVEKKLNEIFYNINAGTLHDYETYENMRTLGEKIFGLNIVPSYLPSQTLEQGTLDVLRIMKKLKKFLNSYKYNIYNQTFLEVTDDNRMLNSIGIQQIADSITTHGLGIMNTYVDKIYGYIGVRFNNLSQFLFDDHIKSKLIRERRWFKANKKELNGQYPYPKANVLRKQIKQIGVFPDGTGYLDQLQILITQIGNSLGFVRLLRSASIQYCSANIEFLPEHEHEGEEELSFTKMTEESGLTFSTKKCAKQLDDIHHTWTNAFSERQDYLRILTKIFDGKLNPETHSHLKYFYMILPALMIQFIDSMLIAKEKLNKKNAPKAYLTDDGFAMGLAYLLHILEMESMFNSLHWFNTVTQKFKQDMAKAKESHKNPRNYPQDEEEADQQLQMSMRKLTHQRNEFEVFYYSFNAAQVLFRDS